jgi:GNAT superfamily N-acetyltransferase
MVIPLINLHNRFQNNRTRRWVFLQHIVESDENYHLVSGTQILGNLTFVQERECNLIYEISIHHFYQNKGYGSAAIKFLAEYSAEREKLFGIAAISNPLLLKIIYGLNLFSESWISTSISMELGQPFLEYYLANQSDLESRLANNQIIPEAVSVIGRPLKREEDETEYKPPKRRFDSGHLRQALRDC